MGGGVSGGGMAVGQEERSRNRVWGGINVVFPNSGMNTVACKIGTYYGRTQIGALLVLRSV